MRVARTGEFGLNRPINISIVTHGRCAQAGFLCIGRSHLFFGLRCFNMLRRNTRSAGLRPCASNLSRLVISEPLEARTMLAVNVAIDVNTRYQQIDGFGTADGNGGYATQFSPAYQQMMFQDMGSSILRVAVD